MESESFRFDRLVRFESFLSGVRLLLACEKLVCFLRLNKSAVDGHCELADVDDDDINNNEDEELSIAFFPFVNDDFALASIFLRPAMALFIRFCSSRDSTSSSVITNKIDISFRLFKCGKRGFFTGISEHFDDDVEPFVEIEHDVFFSLFFVLLHESSTSLL